MRRRDEADSVEPLALLLKAGHREAAGQVFELLRDRIRACAWKRGHGFNLNRQDREDMVQEVFLALPHMADRWNPDSHSFMHWVGGCIPWTIQNALGRMHGLMRNKIRYTSELADFALSNDAATSLAARVVHRLIEAAPHGDIVGDHYGLLGNGQLSVNQLRAKRRLSVRKVKSAIDDGMAFMRAHAAEIYAEEKLATEDAA